MCHQLQEEGARLQQYKQQLRTAFAQTLDAPVPSWSRATIDTLSQIYLSADAARAVEKLQLTGSTLSGYFADLSRGPADLELALIANGLSRADAKDAVARLQKV